jgi:hypothetical protein
MGGSSPPASPDPAKSYQKEIGIYLQYLPQLLQAEQSARSTYDPANIEHQLQLQGTYGPEMYQQQLDALHQLDPAGSVIRDQLAGNVSKDLASGYALPDDFSQQLDTQIRGAQAARGNVLGAAPITAEGAYKGKAAIDLYQQHLDNAGQFLGLQTPEAAISQITPVTADRSSAYVNPNAGFLGQQFAMSNYGNQLAGYNASNAAGNPWARALSGAASGAAVGSAGGGWGSLIGAGVGAVGGYLSDRRLKKNVIEVGVSPNGHKIYEFNLRGYVNRFRGVMAQDLLKTLPSAVTKIGEFLMVDYDQVDVPLEAI